MLKSHIISEIIFGLFAPGFIGLISAYNFCGFWFILITTVYKPFRTLVSSGYVEAAMV